MVALIPHDNCVKMKHNISDAHYTRILVAVRIQGEPLCVEMRLKCVGEIKNIDKLKSTIALRRVNGVWSSIQSVSKYTTLRFKIYDPFPKFKFNNSFVL